MGVLWTGFVSASGPAEGQILPPIRLRAGAMNALTQSFGQGGEIPCVAACAPWSDAGTEARLHDDQLGGASKGRLMDKDL